MKKNFFEWIAYVFLFIWQLPQNIAGFFMWLFFKMRGDVVKIDATKWSTAYKSKYMSGGISLGMFCFLSEYGATQKTSIAHELKGHTVDSRIMGPLYLFIVGIPSILNAAFDFTKCYYDWYPEKWANKHAGLEVDTYCKLKFKEEEPQKIKVQAKLVQEDIEIAPEEAPKTPEDELNKKIADLSARIKAIRGNK